MKNQFKYLLLAFVASTMVACSNTKYLPEGETLYTGAKVIIDDSVLTKSEKKALEEELTTYVRPYPNRKLLGLRARLWVWNVVGEPKKETGIRSWLRNKLGEPPVYGSDVRLENNNLVLENQMFNKGFFHASSLGEKVTKNKRTKAEFEIKSGPQYKYRTVEYQGNDSLPIHILLKEEINNSFLKVGEPYNLNNIIAERERLGKALNNKGYYFFNSDYLLTLIDTTKDGTNELNARIILKDQSMPKAAFYPFKINEILILPNNRITSSIGNTSKDTVTRRRVGRPEDTTVYENYTVVDRQKSVREIVFKESIQFEKGEYYSDEEQNKTMNRLIGTGLFKFVKSDFTVAKDPSVKSGTLFDVAYNTLLQRGLIVTPDPKLNVTYQLTQLPKKNINLEYGAYTLNDARVGNRLNFTWRNINLFRGAEYFSARAVGGFEMQYGGQNRRPNTYNLGVEGSLSVPRFLVPFFNPKSSTNFLPRTALTAKYDFFLRSQLYRIHSATLSLGYTWKESITKEHKFNPINITYVKTDTFAEDTDIRFQNILFNGLIIGPTYEYTYNSQVGAKRKHEFYFNGLADFSGNILGLIQKADYETNPKEIFNNPYAQFLKLQTDFRYYLNLNKSQSLATRVFAGYGLPYGNSKILPNVKQLFSGGISSVRGFNARMIGPGTFNELYQNGTQTYIEMLGDIKLESNIEFRSKIYDFLHGAVFVDAGNVWLQNENPSFPGGKISKNFYKELAVGTGFGLRLDFSVIMIRVDVGIPIRKPWMPEGQRWVFDKIAFGNDVWRRENIVFGFAIGYPF